MKIHHEAQEIPAIPNAKISILKTKWYPEYLESMVEKCIQTLAASQCVSPQVHTISGSLELPIAAQTLARSHSSLEGIICFGAIVKGETYHFEMVMDECIRGIGRVSLQEDIPIIVEVLPVTSLDQLKARCGDDDHNKGIEAAYAVAEMIAWRRSIRGGG